MKWVYHHDKFSNSFFKPFFPLFSMYLRNRGRLLSANWLPHIAAMAKAGLGGSQEPRVQSRSPARGVGTRLLEPSLLLPRMCSEWEAGVRTRVRNWIQITYTRRWHLNWCLTCLAICPFPLSVFMSFHMVIIKCITIELLFMTLPHLGVQKIFSSSC